MAGRIIERSVGDAARAAIACGLRCSNQHESKGRSRLISSLAGAAWRWSCATQLTFLRSAFMLLVSAFDPILVLIAIVR
jgi:hypothetical protein